MNKRIQLNWGVLGAAKIAREKVIPAMAGHPDFQVLGIASRSLEKATAAAQQLQIPRAYGSYSELLADPDIDIIYNPLPNHLHVPYTLQAIAAGKHVLCEKPLALQSSEIEKLIAAKDRHGVKVGEAFMVKTHPQWLKAREIVQAGLLGNVRLIQGIFSYHNINPDNIRNIGNFGGGALWDIGCYLVTTARFLLGEEPLRVVAHIDKNKSFNTDVLSSVMMVFPTCHVQFSVSTQLAPYQRVHVLGEAKELEIMIPFNAPKDRACILRLNSGDIFQENIEAITIEPCDQYRIQAEAFTRSVREDTPEPVPLEDALANTRVLEAIFQSARDEKWIDL